MHVLLSAHFNLVRLQNKKFAAAVQSSIVARTRRASDGPEPLPSYHQTDLQQCMYLPKLSPSASALRPISIRRRRNLPRSKKNLVHTSSINKLPTTSKKSIIIIIIITITTRPKKKKREVNYPPPTSLPRIKSTRHPLLPPRESEVQTEKYISIIRDTKEKELINLLTVPGGEGWRVTRERC